jgi:hypothetical protein
VVFFQLASTIVVCFCNQKNIRYLCVVIVDKVAIYDYSKKLFIHLLIMDLQTRKIEFIQEFLKIQSEDLVLRLDKLLKKETSKVEVNQLKPFTVIELQNRISKSMKDSKAGKLTANSELLYDIKQWR